MTTTVTEAYSRRAAEYTQLLGSMGAVHASDRQLIDSWADTLAGPVLDAGCGPGHWTHHLAGRGLDVRGIDLVPAFVEHARQSYPDVPFRIGSIDAIEEADGALGGVLSWYSTIHHHPSRVAATFDEFARVLRPGGGLVVGFFDGPVLEAFDHAVTPAYRWPPEELERLLTARGFTVSEIRTRADQGQRSVGAIVAELRSAL